MRFVSLNNIDEGMILAKPVYNEKGSILLQAGVKLKNNYIYKIHELGYNGIYVQDERLEDVEVKEIVSEELKRETVNEMKDTFQDINRQMKISKKKVNEIKKSVDVLLAEIIENKNLMVNMMDLKIFDDYTFHHSVNVTILSLITGISLGLNNSELYKLGLGALLHDVGKVNIPKEILNKSGKLGDNEFNIIQQHPVEGYKILKENDEIPTTSYMVALHHHEKFAGKGYPEGKNGSDIHLYSRIASVADVYDALVSDRPYRKGFAPSEAMEFILGGSGTNFDRDIVTHFFKKVAPYPVGTEVILSDNRQGIVIENFEKYTLRPKVRITKENGADITPYDIDLRENILNSVTIVSTPN